MLFVQSINFSLNIIIRSFKLLAVYPVSRRRAIITFIKLTNTSLVFSTHHCYIGLYHIMSGLIGGSVGYGLPTIIRLELALPGFPIRSSQTQNYLLYIYYTLIQNKSLILMILILLWVILISYLVQELFILFLQRFILILTTFLLTLMLMNCLEDWIFLPLLLVLI